MTHVFGLLLFILALIIHEAGHAIAMTRRQVQVQEAGIGMPLTGKFRLTFRTRFLPYPLIVTPVLIGAYVRPSPLGQQQLERMSYRDQAVCYAAGVIMNIVFAAGLVFIASGIALFLPGYDHSHDAVLLVIAAIVGIGTVLLRRLISVVVHVLGVAILGGLIVLFVQSSSNISGPVGTIGASVSATSWLDGLILGAALSLSLAALNMVPLTPLDGGKVMESFLRRYCSERFSKQYSTVTGVFFLAFLVYLIGKDIAHL